MSRAGALPFLLVMLLGYAVYAADRTVLASVLVPLSRSMGLSNIQQGLLVSAQYIGVLLVVFAAGSLSDRYGKWKMVLTGVTVFSSFTWLIGLTTNFYQAFAFRLISGVGEGIFWPVGMSAVANYFGSSKGMALGAFYVGFDLGGATGSAIGGATFNLTSDWRTAFFVAPLLGIGVLAGIALSRKAFAESEGRAGSVSMGKGAISFLGRRSVAAIMLFAFFATYPIAVWQNYLPKYLNSVFGVSVPFAAYGYAVILLSGAVGKVILGRASDAVRRNQLLRVVSLASLLLFIGFFAAPDPYLGIALGVGVGFLTSAMFPVMQALASDSCDGNTGTALGLTTTFQSAATVFAPTIAAAYFSAGVGGAVSANVLIPMVIVVFITVFLREPRR